jgi:uncharacterized protein YvpB
MRSRLVGFITIMLVANAGLFACLAVTVLANQVPPPVPLVVTAALFPSPLPSGEVSSAAPTHLPAPTTTEPTPSDAATPTPAVAGTRVPPDLAPSPVPEIAPEVASIEDLPATATVSGVVGHRQSLPLSCESRSAADWAAYFGVRIDELEFLGRLPASDDPDRGFVGDVHGAWGQVPPNAYGVHAGPVAKLLTAYGLQADGQRYLKWSSVQRELAAGRPVLVWVAGHVEPGHTSEVYVAADGRETVVARFEHTVIVVGYTADTVTIVDGAQLYTRQLSDFLDAWGVLRNMAVLYAGP